MAPFVLTESQIGAEQRADDQATEYGGTQIVGMGLGGCGEGACCDKSETGDAGNHGVAKGLHGFCPFRTGQAGFGSFVRLR